MREDSRIEYRVMYVETVQKWFLSSLGFSIIQVLFLFIRNTMEDAESEKMVSRDEIGENGDFNQGSKDSSEAENMPRILMPRIRESRHVSERTRQLQVKMRVSIRTRQRMAKRDLTWIVISLVCTKTDDLLHEIQQNTAFHHSEFRFCENRVRQLKYYMDSQKRQGFRQLWRDKRDALNYYTFWGVIIFGASTL